MPVRWQEEQASKLSKKPVRLHNLKAQSSDWAFLFLGRDVSLLQITTENHTEPQSGLTDNVSSLQPVERLPSEPVLAR